MGVLLILQTTLVISVYIIATQHGYLESPKLYLSSAFRRDPARAIAGFILPVTAMIYGILVSHRLWQIFPLLRNGGDRRIFWISVFGLACAVFGMIGVSAVSLDTSKLIHWITAAILFNGSGVLMLTLTLLDKRLRVAQPGWIMWVKIGFTALTFISLAVMFSAVFFSYLVGSIFELILAAVLVAYLVTLVHDSCYPIIANEKVPRSPRDIQDGL